MHLPCFAAAHRGVCGRAAWAGDARAGAAVTERPGGAGLAGGGACEVVEVAGRAGHAGGPGLGAGVVTDAARAAGGGSCAGRAGGLRGDGELGLKRGSFKWGSCAPGPLAPLRRPTDPHASLSSRPLRTIVRCKAAHGELRHSAAHTYSPVPSPSRIGCLPAKPTCSP